MSAKGHIDSYTSEQVVRVSKLSMGKNMWVDCRAVTAISTKALRSVLSLSGSAEKEGVALMFYQLRPALKGIFQEAGFSGIDKINSKTG